VFTRLRRQGLQPRPCWRRAVTQGESSSTTRRPKTSTRFKQGATSAAWRSANSELPHLPGSTARSHHPKTVAPRPLNAPDFIRPQCLEAEGGSPPRRQDIIPTGGCVACSRWRLKRASKRPYEQTLADAAPAPLGMTSTVCSCSGGLREDSRAPSFAAAPVQDNNDDASRGKETGSDARAVNLARTGRCYSSAATWRAYDPSRSACGKRDAAGGDGLGRRRVQAQSRLTQALAWQRVKNDDLSSSTRRRPAYNTASPHPCHCARHRP